MAGTSEFTTEQQKHFVAIAQKKGRKPAAKLAGVTPTTISHWAKALKVDLRVSAAAAPSAPKKAPAPKNGKASNGKASNGHASNGHAPSAAAPVTVQGLDAVRTQLEGALKSLDAMQSAFRQVFG